MLVRKLFTTLITSLLLISSSLSSADDTSIFLSNPNYDSSAKPNVLFVLDNSGSMGYQLNESTRLKELQTSFESIMRSTSNINAGLMKLHKNSGDTSSLTYPISDIDQPYGSTRITKSGIPEILESTDDAQEFLGNNSVAVTSPTLSMGRYAAPSSSPLRASAQSGTGITEEVESQIDRFTDNLEDSRTTRTTGHMSLESRGDRSNVFHGLYFRGLAIPANARIEEAYLQLTASYGDTGSFHFVINAEHAKSPYPFLSNISTLNDNLKNRINPHVAGTEWSVSGHGSNWALDSTYQSPDISQSIQAVLDNPNLSWQPGEQLDNLALILNFPDHPNNGLRRVYQYLNGSSNNHKAAKLYVKYSTQPTASGDYLAALRFQNVGIPSESIITSAKLVMTSAANDSEPVTLEISPGGLQSNNSRPFSGTAGDLSSRSRDSGNLISVTWNPGPWEASGTGDDQVPKRYEVDIKDSIQYIVDTPGWCGNDSATLFIERKSGDGKRVAYSFDGSMGNKPRLVIEYEPHPTGCINERLSTRIEDGSHDGYESRLNDYNYTTGTEVHLQSESNLVSNNYPAFYYPYFPVKKGAQILSAHLELTASRSDSTDIKIRIQAEDRDDTEALSSGYNGISERRNNLTDHYVDWQVNEPWETNETYSSPDISDVIKEVIDRDGWTAGNGLTLMLSAFGNRSNRYVMSYENNPAYSPKLVLKLADGGLDANSAYKVKDHMISLVNEMVHGGNTPIMPRMFEAASYYVSELEGVNSPITHTCQSNHLVILTDGEANSNKPETVSGITDLIGRDCSTDTNRYDEQCGRSLAEWLSNTDLNSTIDGDNTVKTHTIAFATGDSDLAKQFMQDLASEGQGSYYTADNAQELAKAFHTIFEEVLANESTFSAPGVAANSFNRSEHLNKVYYSIFKPSTSDRWFGNLKKYQLLGDPISVHDNQDPAQPAVDSDTGFFAEDTKSFWLDENEDSDGGVVSQGGANGRLKRRGDGNPRKIYTYLGNNPAGTAVSIANANHEVVDSNTALQKSHFGLNGNQDARRTAVIDWIRDTKKGLGDPLHSTPALATYRCTDTYSASSPFSCTEDGLDLKLFVGTNDGMLHILDAETGDEEFAFIPQELLPLANKLETNNATNRAPGNGRPYGLDGHLVIWANDANHNGVIYGGADTLNSNGSTLNELTGLNDNEFVYAYVGMRRGGRNYYALDVTDVSNPKMLWFIKGGEGDFQQLGQTWSRPVRTRIQMGSTVEDVLIFSGGYDASQDTTPDYQQDAMGNAIYIVNARTGELIWSASGSSNGNPNIRLGKMKYSIPGGVTVADLQGDGLADQILAADTGGQVWRFYINNCIPAPGTNSISHCAVQSANDAEYLVWPADSNNDGIGGSIGTDNVMRTDDGVIAYLGHNNQMSDTTKRQHARKFYTRPDVTSIAVQGKSRLAVSIGSGIRPDPLGTLNGSLQDRFYQLLMDDIYNPEVTSSNRGTVSVPAHSTITDTGTVTLADLTPDSNGNADNNERRKLGGTGNQGWFINMPATEKVMSDPAVYNSRVFFNTYKPSNSASNICSPVAGEAWSWELDLHGNLIDREKIESNGIVGNSVFVRTDKLVYDSDGNLMNKGKTTVIGRGTDWSELTGGQATGTTYWIQKK